MQYTARYASPLGEILLAADEAGLTGLWFEGQKYFARQLGTEHEKGENPALCQAKQWLDAYFSGQRPDFMPPLHFLGTAFQIEVWELLRTIPYGQTVTYAQLAAALARQRGGTMSAQAVGSAVGRNPISVIVPCHRVVGTSGSLTGYAGGISKKIALLNLEGAWQERFFVPKNTTAP